MMKNTQNQCFHGVQTGLHVTIFNRVKLSENISLQRETNVFVNTNIHHDRVLRMFSMFSTIQTLENSNVRHIF